MTGGATSQRYPGSPEPVQCYVRYLPRGQRPDPAPAELDGVLRRVEEQASRWGQEICSFLNIAPVSPVMITLRDDPGLPMTKRSNIRLPLPDGLFGCLADDLRVLAHELVHALAGRAPTHLLNEGLAVHTDARLRLAGPVWPFYHLDPHRWTSVFRDAGTYLPLADLIATPQFEFSGKEPNFVLRRFYVEAASYTQFLVDRMGLEEFWVLYHSDSALPPDDDVEPLEAEWLASIGPELTPAERQLKEASIHDLRRLGPAALADGPARRGGSPAAVVETGGGPTTSTAGP